VRLSKAIVLGWVICFSKQIAFGIVLQRQSDGMVYMRKCRRVTWDYDRLWMIDGDYYFDFPKSIWNVKRGGLRDQM
jgi:hypothetical protein